MSYEIKFKGRDNDSIIVDNEVGEKMRELWIGGQSSTPVQIKDNAYRIGDINKIVKVADPTPLPNYERIGIESKQGCKAKYSIQKEINNIARDDGKGWARLIRDKAWREQTRQELRKASDEWCDYKAGTCAC